MDKVKKVRPVLQMEATECGAASLAMILGYHGKSVTLEELRLGLAAALMGDPEIVILDEPVNGLDIEGVVEIREYIKTMNEKYNTTFVISSHIASEIEKLSTTTAVIYDGELVSIDSTQHIMSLYPSMEDYFLEKVHERRGSI